MDGMNGWSFPMVCWSKHKLLTLISLSPLFCYGCARILQQVCCFIFLLVEYLFCSPLKAHFQVACVSWICLVVLSPFPLINTEPCRKNAVMSTPTGHTWLHSPSSPPPPPSVRLSPRLSALSLRSMHPCPIPDAEAHGKDGNNCPMQLYLSNGEECWCFLSHCIQPYFIALVPFCQTFTAVVQRPPASLSAQSNIWFLHLHSGIFYICLVKACTLFCLIYWKRPHITKARNVLLCSHAFCEKC